MYMRHIADIKHLWKERACNGRDDRTEKSDFYFDLPQELIAQDPLEDRSSSRLLVLDKIRERSLITFFGILSTICIPETVWC